MRESDEQVREEQDAIHHLEEALEMEEMAEVKFRIRQALQLLRVQ